MLKRTVLASLVLGLSSLGFVGCNTESTDTAPPPADTVVAPPGDSSAEAPAEATPAPEPAEPAPATP